MSSEERIRSSDARSRSSQRFVRIGLFCLLILSACCLGLGLGRWLRPPPGPPTDQVLEQSRQVQQQAQKVIEEIQRQQPELERRLNDLRDGPVNPGDLK